MTVLDNELLEHKEYTEYVYSVINSMDLGQLRTLHSVVLPECQHGMWTDIHKWCTSQFGKRNYTWAGTRFYFKREKDAVLFTLRWL